MDSLFTPTTQAEQLGRPGSVSEAGSSYRFSVAPMMDWTDRHCRVLMRLISPRTRLYTEMVTANALVYGKDSGRFLDHHPAEHPLALQLGGSDPGLLAKAAQMGAAAGYDEINLNIGCPSDRVTSGRFGACLMAEPALVGDCVAAIAAVVDIPVTVKTRIGIDDRDDDEILDQLVQNVRHAGCNTVIVHARRAILKGLSPKENREIPPLRYDRVYRLKQSQPHLNVILNGGVKTLDEVQRHLTHVDGVMVGRAAYERPFEVLREVDHRIFGIPPAACDEIEIIRRYIDYAKQMEGAGFRRSAPLRHLTGMLRSRPGARRWRQQISAANLPSFRWADLMATLETIGSAEALAA